MSKKKNIYRPLLIVFLLAVLWELFIFIKLPKQAFVQGLLESWLVSQGLIFYRDFGGQYLPFLRLLMVPLHNIFGFSQYTTIVLSPITTLSILFILFFVSNKWLKGWFKLIPIMFFSIWHTFLSNNHFLTTSFLGVTVLISVILWLSWWDKPTAKKSFLIGLFTAFSVFTLQIVLPFYIILNLSFLLRFKNNVRKVLNHLLEAFFGFLIPTLAIILWFWSKGALYDLYTQTIEYHFTNYPYAILGRGTENILIFLSIHLPVLLLLVNGLKSVKNLTLFVMLGLLPLAFWFAIFHPLRFEISLPAFVLIFGLGVQDALASKSLKVRRVGGALLILILLLNLYTITKYKLISYKEKLFETDYTHPVISEIYRDDPIYDAIEWMKVNSSSQDKIFVLGDALFYVYAGRLPANRRAVASEPFVYLPFEKFKSEIEDSPPDYWVIDERLWLRYEDWPYPEVIKGFQSLLEDEEVVARFDYWTIRKHRD